MIKRVDEQMVVVRKVDLEVAMAIVVQAMRTHEIVGSDPQVLAAIHNIAGAFLAQVDGIEPPIDVEFDTRVIN